MPSDRVAMFIDFENLVFGVENRHYREADAQAESGDDDYDIDIQRLVRFVRDEGRLVMARAYADWRNASVRAHQQDLYNQGIETVHVFGRRHGAEVKNAVDVALAVDAVRSLFEREYDTFVLISGDRDFLPLLRIVREHGHRIIGVSVRESASRDLPNLCDRFVYYRDLWRTWGPDERREWNLRSEGEIRDLAHFKDHLRELLLDEVGVGGSGILGATLKPMIRNRIDPGFDETQFGFLKFSKLLEAMPEVVRLEYTSDAHGGDILVFPVAAPESDSDGEAGGEAGAETGSVRASAPRSPIISRPSQAWAPTPEAFLTRARARLARTGLHLDHERRSEVLELVYSALPVSETFRSQSAMLEELEGRSTRSGLELDPGTARRYLWALYQSWVFDISPSERNLDHLERGLRLKPEYQSLDLLGLRLEQSLVYKVYELLPDDEDDRLARISDLLEVDDDRARQLLARVEDYRRSQHQRGRS